MSTLMSLHNIRGALQDRRINVVSEATGLSRNTVSGIRSGKITDPSYSVVERLSDYLQGVK